jgi:hypothetical protein
VAKTIELQTITDRARFGDLYPRADAFDTCRQTFAMARRTSGGRWTCTRETGHDGPHVAHDSAGLVLALYGYGR